MRRALDCCARSRGCRQGRTGVRVDAQDGAVEHHRLAGRAEALAPQGTASARWRALGAADRDRRIAARVERVAVLPVIDEVEARAVTAADVQRAVGTEHERADGVARVLLAPVLDQHLFRCRHDVARRLEARQPSADDATVVVGPGGVGQGSAVTPDPSEARCRQWGHRRCKAGRRRDGREPGSRAMPRSPRSQKLWTFVRRSTKMSGVGSVRLLKILTRPLFSRRRRARRVRTTRPSAG